MSRTILHVDMDAFFAAIEQQRRPELRGRPVVVGGSGDPRRRGVVSTASYEARAYGIRSAMPLRVAYRRCPDAVFLPVDMETYAAVSQTIMEILREYTPLVEPVSLDEAFLDVSGHPDPRGLAEQIRAQIRQRTGLTASIGIGPNKLLAKIASGLRKPDAVTEIRAEEAPQVLAPLPVTVLWGVGPKTAALLERELGVRTVGDLQRVPAQALADLLGPRRAREVARASRGEDDSPVVTTWEPRSCSREITYQRDARRRETIDQTLDRLVEDVVDDLRAHRYRARTVTVKIRYHDFRTHTRSQTLPEPTDDAERIRAAARALVDRFTLDRPVRLVGVRLSGLVRDGHAGPQTPDRA